MASLKNYSSLFVVIILSITTRNAMASSFPSPAVKGAYWPSSSDFPSSAIDTTLFTHIYYAFLIPNNVTFKFEVSDSMATMLLNFTSTLRSKNPPVKTLFSVGGGGGDLFVLFGHMASNASSRKSFIDSSIEVARKFGFDGIDLDWEFPQNPKEMENLGHLLQEWRAEVQKEAKEMGRAPLLLTAAVYFSVDFFLDSVPRSYPVGSVSKNLDWINVMCYDYHGSWNTSATGAQSALFDPKSNVTTSYGLGSWIKAGFPRRKLIMGLPLYGRTWQLKDPKMTGVGASAVATGPGNGVLNYNQVVMFNMKNNATVEYDLDTVSTYSFSGTSWIGYDDPMTTMVKIGYAQALGLRGYFFWAVNGDYEWEVSKQASKLWIL